MLLSVAGAQVYVRNVSKVSTTAGAVLEMPAGARALAMGNAQSAAPGSGSVFYWNPAAASIQDRLLVSSTYIPWLADTYYSHVAAVIPVPGRFVLGASVSSWGMDDMPVRTEERQHGTGEQFDAGDLVMSVSVARSLTDRFAVGFTGKFIQERVWHSSARGFALDFGTLFRTDIGNGLYIAAVISNYGTDMRLDGRDVGILFDPDPTIEGNNDQIPSKYEMDTWPLPLNFRFALATDVVRSDRLRVTAEIDALHPSNNYESVDAGVEVAFSELAFLRFGYAGLFLKDSIEGISLGGGVELPLRGRTTLSLDYGFRDMGPLGYLQALTLNVGT